jgi:DNA processing protein
VALEDAPGADREDTLLWIAFALALGRSRFATARRLAALGGALDWERLTRLLRLARRRGVRDIDSIDSWRERASVLLDRGRRSGMKVISWTNPDYPARLRHVADPPPVLWTQTEGISLDCPSIAIVGARAATSGALAVARQFGRDLAARGFTVVSGLARGVDRAAHEGALEAGLTVAVLGGGLDVLYPPEHADLARRITARGALMSEFPPGTPPLPGHFPLRNRIVAGLSMGVVVVEAGEKSGALITAHAALEQGKEVMVVPGAAHTGRNRGGHALIKDGAALVEDANDVVGVLQACSPAAGGAGLPFDAAPRASPAKHASVIDAQTAGSSMTPPSWRRGEDLDLDELQRLTGLQPAALLGRLLEWELTGTIVRTPAGRFMRL